MWLVRNNLRGTLTFRGLEVSIPAGSEFDLDGVGRGVAEDSSQVQVAFEEGYLSNILKEATSIPGDLDTPASSTDLAVFKQSILNEIRTALPQNQAPGGLTAEQMRGELADLKSALVGDMQSLLGNLKVAKLRLKEERERVLIDPSLSEVETRARLAFLDEQGSRLEKNFERLGKAQSSSAPPGDLLGKVDLLSNI